MTEVTEKPCTKCGVVKSLSDFYKNASKKYGVLSHCKVCHDSLVLAWQKRNKEKRVADQRAKSSKWSKDNPDKRRANARTWKKNNPSKDLADVCRRRAQKLRATPGWADQKAIGQYYLIASFLSVELGIDFHVDHVVPLRSKAVQGFHSQHNLSIALGAWNLSKSNKWWPDMPEDDHLPIAA